MHFRRSVNADQKITEADWAEARRQYLEIERGAHQKRLREKEEREVTEKRIWEEPLLRSRPARCSSTQPRAHLRQLLRSWPPHRHHSCLHQLNKEACNVPPYRGLSSGRAKFLRPLRAPRKAECQGHPSSASAHLQRGLLCLGCNTKWQ